ncbi:MAG: hypothetical protein O3C40_35185, partial [Planctomycetota bacterium]|nr:hypothetical protein [Planctomycetota bacterium]
MYRFANGLLKLLIGVVLISATVAVISGEASELSAAELAPHVQRALEAELEGNNARQTHTKSFVVQGLGQDNRYS